jgi:endonuclease VIII-like 1
MPELAELKLTADFINAKSQQRAFIGVKKNPVHKGKSIIIPFKSFNISAKNRGKELMLTISDNNSTEKKHLLMTMGMSGHFAYTYTTNEPKHSHLMFFTNDGTTLSFVDVRRFGKWKWVNDWSPNRGPDPMAEFEDFKKHIKENINKTAFNHPIHLALMNQKYFNGVGNYIRAEVLGRIPELNPFTEARVAIQKYPEILSLCKEIPSIAYMLGGGQLKDWVNPHIVDESDFKNFIRFYSNKQRCIPIKDKNGRTFWCDKKWDSPKKLDMDIEWDYYSDLPNPKAYK